MAHPVGKLTQPRAFGPMTGRRYGDFDLKGGDVGGTIEIPLVLNVRVSLGVSPSLVTTIPLVLDVHTRLSMPQGVVRVSQPKA